MRTRPSILHLDLDAFFAAVEQRDKPSLRGKPVIVGGLGQRGVVSTASYEARPFGVRSAMPMHEARRRCPHAAFLSVRFGAYRIASGHVMSALRSVSPLVEPLSLDEAFVDLAAATRELAFTTDDLTDLAQEIKAEVAERTGGLKASIGIGTSKFIAKLATELDKPDGCRIVPHGTEVDLIAPLSVRVIPGVGPATGERLQRLGVRTVADLQAMTLAELTRELGKAAGTNLHALAFARDDRHVEAEREAKSISVEDTFEHDERDPARLAELVERDAAEVATRVRAGKLFARTVTLKVRRPDFTTWTRSRTLDGATDRTDVIARIARELLAGLDLSEGVRLIGVGVSGLTRLAQEELFGPDGLSGDGPSTTPSPAPPGRVGSQLSLHAEANEIVPSASTWSDNWEATAGMEAPADTRTRRRPSTWLPGVDVLHDEHGPGWVWGAGIGRVTVRFETAETGPGPVRTFRADDSALHLADLPQAPDAPEAPGITDS
ncbi:DNA polymerase IV [Ammonicoccus fulvus]|uniref:DNA polymerase IV n=1 Tax=Ammonicoccus fulvus TaxID=3138240 RepID=A0ABZ3FN31_9ACTN